MRSVFGTGVLITAGLFCLLTTVSAFQSPGAFAKRLGLTIANAAGTNEIIAQYACFFGAVAIICGLATIGIVGRQSAFIVLIVVFGGLISGRLTSLAINGGFSGYTPTIISLYFIDSFGLVLAASALVTERSA